jgi:hypothetical protein
LAGFRLRGRRRGFRRREEGRNQYVDCLSTRVSVLAFLILCSSVLDALFTLLHVGDGAREINPLMQVALRSGMPAFVAAKTGITGLGIIVLAAHQHLRLGFFALHGIAALYVALLAYHGVLFYY